jgi:kynureninase
VPLYNTFEDVLRAAAELCECLWQTR